MTDTITEARINRTIQQLRELERTLQGEHDTTAALQTLTSLALDLAASVRTIAQRNP
jgi:hypothetical protein